MQTRTETAHNESIHKGRQGTLLNPAGFCALNQNVKDTLRLRVGLKKNHSHDMKEKT